MAIFQMTIDCDVPAKLQLEEEVLVESLISALIRKALKGGCGMSGCRM
jgi:hypothetical protein